LVLRSGGGFCVKKYQKKRDLGKIPSSGLCRPAPPVGEGVQGGVNLVAPKKFAGRKETKQRRKKKKGESEWEKKKKREAAFGSKKKKKCSERLT